ncbi:MAG TPA: galactokinase family protein, partial [Solirubrobacteraceae bacterium]|nr:galactokinase family protein [Solirubrobacteraceae bacterium]
MNLIGEHTDYNGGLALPFAIAQGVTVRAERRGAEVVVGQAPGAEAFVRGAAAELRAAGVAVGGAGLRVESDLPQGAGLASSAALTVAVALALLGLAGEEMDRMALARLCSRVENQWAGARTGLLDQIASLFGEEGHALLVDFATLERRPVPLALGEWRLVLLDSGERRALGDGRYDERRAECERGDERRLRHVHGENARVRAAVAALDAGDVAALGPLLDASHASLR